jgi:hypothetical protein
MPPVVIAGGIAAAGAIGGAVLSSSAQKKAANTAATAETNAANVNIAAAQQFQAQNQGNLQPFLNSGYQGNALINSFLFGPQTGGSNGGGSSGAPAAPAGQDWNGYLQANPDVANDYNAHVDHNQFPTAQAYAQWHYQHYGQNEGRQVPTFGQQAGSNALASPSAGIDAYKTFTESPTYQFPLQEGMRQLNTGLASHGQIHSGDAMKEAIGYGQNYASGQLNNFLGLAENQTNRGIQAGGAIAGVGVNALNSITNSNNAVGQAAANRAIAGGVANSNLYAGIGSALGNFAGSFAPTASSYRF